VSPNGTVAVVNWDTSRGLTSSTRERSTLTWQFPNVLIAPGTGPPVQEVGAAAGPDGSIWIDAWRFDANTDFSDLQAFGLGPNGLWLGPELVASNGLGIEGGYHDPQIGVLSDGTVVAAYKENWELVARIRPTNGVWSPHIDLAFGVVNITDYLAKSILTSASGDALVVAQDDMCPVECAGFAVPFDGAPPRLTVSVPASGVQGEAVSMSATAVDAFSALDASTSWVFDDGASASGDAVTHSFTSAGDHVVTISRADVLGQRAVLAKTIHIALAAVHCPGSLVLPGGSTCPKPAITRFTARVVGSWKVSRWHGAVNVRAHLTSGKLTGSIALLRPNGATLRVLKFTSRADLAVKLALPALATPGRWSVRVAARDTLGHQVRATRRFMLNAPVEGVVSDATVTSDPSHPATLTLDGRLRRAYARFIFAALPKAGQTVAVTWYHKGLVLRVAKPARRVVAATLRSFVPLPAGRWRCVIRAGGREVKSIAFTIVF
jgi:hypothetical protein